MKVYSYAERISLADLLPMQRPDPAPGPKDVVIKMFAAALNYRDIAIARGHYHTKMEAPLVPLSDGAGQVVAVGAEVTRLKVGDLACPVYLPDWIDGPVRPSLLRRRLGGPNDGVLAEYMCLNEEEIVRAPSHLEPAEAATLAVSAVTAWQALYQTSVVRPGDTVLVLGAGGVSTAALQFACAGGARVIAITRREAHVARLRQLGADEVLHVASDEDWSGRVLRLTGGEGVDTVVEVVGGVSLARSIASLRLGGRIQQVGYAGDTEAKIDIFDAIRHGANIHVATAGCRRSFESLVKVMERDKIKPPVEKRFGVADLGEAFDHLSKAGHFGKVVVDIAAKAA